jgi:Tol biopolymer transport system component
MTDNSHQTLERLARRVPVPEPAYDRLLRRRDRKERNRRISAAVLAIVLTLLSITGLLRAFGDSRRPATEPTPTPVDTGIFSGMGGWIAYGDLYRSTHGGPSGISGIWAMDPERPGTRKQLSTHGGEPLAWSSDGSKLLILRASGSGSTADESLSVLNADGSETLLIDAGAGHGITGGSFSPDGSKVLYETGPFDGTAPDGIYVVDAAGGTPRRLLVAGRRWYSAFGRRVRSLLLSPTFSPDGSQIAYIDGMGDHSNSLRVMNADGSDSRVLLKDAGVMHNSAFPGGLVWSPDGSRLALGLGYIPYTIYVVGADGSGLTRLIARGAHPEWSPDGSRIAYDNSTNGSHAGPLMIANADGTHVQTFNNAASGPWNPLVRAESETHGTSGTAGAMRLDALTYAIAAPAVIGIVVLWRRRKRKKQDVL